MARSVARTLKRMLRGKGQAKEFQREDALRWLEENVREV